MSSLEEWKPPGPFQATWNGGLPPVMARSMLPSPEFAQLRLLPLENTCGVAIALMPAGLESVMEAMAEHPSASVTVTT